MKHTMALGLLSLVGLLSVHGAVHQGAEAVNPIQKVLSMLSDLETKIIKEGAEAQKTYDEFSEWCEDRSKNLGFEIKTGKKDVEESKAIIESSTADIASLEAKIEELADAITVDEADLKAATEIRAEEAKTFKATEKDLVETIDTLERAILILEKEMKKGGAAMVQMQKAGNNLAKALSVMVDASMIANSDVDKLTAFVQSSESDSDSEDETGAPAAAAYEGHAGGIIETLEGLLEKAKGSLAEARSKETANTQNFAMLKQSLEDEIKYANKDMSDAKKSKAETSETKATAEGDLKTDSKELAEDIETMSTLHSDCLAKAQDFEAETKSRGEELKALGTAKKVIAESTSGADTLAYGLDQETSELSLLQVDQTSVLTLSSGADLANFEAVRLVRDLARKTHSPALAQLAVRMAAAIRNARAGADPFAKVKELIKNMIETLLSDAQADATHKAYCDKELGESAEKKADKTATIEKLAAKIDSMSSKSAMLKEQVATLQKELAALASAQAEMDDIRRKEKATYTAAKAEMEEGIEGIKKALAVLRDYYAKDAAHSTADGASSGIVGLLEVVESDFTKGLAEMNIAEQNAVAEYETTSKSNDISKATKTQDVKYKTKEFKGLDSSVAEAKSEKATTQEELDAIMAYLGKLDDICIAKAEPYAERKSRREAEIAGLKQALEILNGEAVFLQQKASPYLRGVKRHA